MESVAKSSATWSWSAVRQVGQSKPSEGALPLVSTGTFGTTGPRPQSAENVLPAGASRGPSSMVPANGLLYGSGEPNTDVNHTAPGMAFT